MHISIPGRPGVGKSQLLRKIRRQVLDREAEASGYRIEGYALQAPWGDWRPILRVATPPEVTIASMATAMLRALADEDPEYGDKGEKTRRILAKLMEQRVRIILIDEFQHLTDHRTDKFAYAAADWLKGLLNEEDATPEWKRDGSGFFVHAVFFGTQTMNAMFVGNGQLARRGRGVHPFRPYDWVDPAERALFGQTLDKIDRMLPFPEASFTGDAIRFDLHRATDAVISRIAAITQLAGFKALDLGQPNITPNLFEQAFDELLWEIGSDDFYARPNPWREKNHEPGIMNAPAPDPSRKTRIKGKKRNDTPDFSKR
ncbi:AAA family ATPase [uncultured Methylobacterium sp.]|uniref:AAA family ATPase n=1 Tax=uncultured Methylobacterium sp. TaxID=157278 RepID=UPI0035C990CC